MQPMWWITGPICNQESILQLLLLWVKSANQRHNQPTEHSCRDQNSHTAIEMDEPTSHKHTGLDTTGGWKICVLARILSRKQKGFWSDLLPNNPMPRKEMETRLCHRDWKRHSRWWQPRAKVSYPKRCWGSGIEIYTVYEKYIFLYVVICCMYIHVYIFEYNIR